MRSGFYGLSTAKGHQPPVPPCAPSPSRVEDALIGIPRMSEAGQSQRRPGQQTRSGAWRRRGGHVPGGSDRWHLLEIDVGAS